MNVISISANNDNVIVTPSGNNNQISVSGAGNFNNLVTTAISDTGIAIVSTSGLQYNLTLLSGSTGILNVATEPNIVNTIVTINQGQQGPPGASGLNGIVSVLNYGDNRVITSSSKDTEVNAESNLLFDGTTLTVGGVAVSLSGHTHKISNITDVTSAGSGIATAPSYAAQNKLGWQIISSGIRAEAGGQYLLPKSAFATTGITILDPLSATQGDFYLVIKNSGSAATTTVIGGVSYPKDSGVLVYRIYNVDTIFPSTASWKSFTLDHYHKHGTNDIVGISGYIDNNINTYLSGLSIISNNCDVEYMLIQDSGNNTKLISISGIAKAISVIDGGGVLYSGC